MDNKRKCSVDDEPQAPPSGTVRLKLRVFYLVDDGNLGEFKKFEDSIDVLNDIDSIGNSYLHRAASSCESTDKERMVQYILNAAPQLTHVRNTWGETALFLACKTNASLRCIRDIVQTNPQCVNIPDNYNKTVLCQFICVVGMGKTSIMEAEIVDVVRLLLDSGSDINAEHAAGKTALFCALMRKDMYSSWTISVVKLLLSRGANVKSKSGSTHALDYVKSPCVAKLILDHDASGLNDVDAMGWTKLHYIMTRKDKNPIYLVKFLLKNGAKLGLNANIFDLAIHMQCGGSERWDFIKELIEKGYDIGSPEQMYKVIFTAGCTFECVELLLQKYPCFNINTRNIFGQSLLMLYGKNIKNIQKLLSMGIDPQISDHTEHNIMHYALLHNQADPKIVKILLEAGMDPSTIIVKDTFHEKQERKNVVDHILDFAFISYKFNKQEWINLFEFALNLPVFKDTSLPENIKKFYMDLIVRVSDICENLEEQEKVLKIIIKANSSVTDMQLNIGDIFSFFARTRLPDTLHYPFKLDPISYMIAQHFNKKSPEFIALMLNCGFMVSKRLDNHLNPLTSLITFVSSTLFQREFDQVFEYLIDDAGVNVHSMILSTNTRNCISYPDIQVPDALYICINQKQVQKSHMKKLLSHWWCPPLLLLTFHFVLHGLKDATVLGNIFSPDNSDSDEDADFYANVSSISSDSSDTEQDVQVQEWEGQNAQDILNLYEIEMDNTNSSAASEDTQQDVIEDRSTFFSGFVDWFHFLADYGGVPHGTKMYKQLDNLMIKWEIKAAQRNKEDIFAPFMNRYKNITSSPLSLQELCKYAVRQNVAPRAARPDTSLPVLLHDLLPPLLRDVVIH